MNSELHFSSPAYLEYFFAKYPHAAIDLASSGRKERSWAELKPILSGIELYNPHFKVAEHALRQKLIDRYRLDRELDLLPVPGTSCANFIALNALCPPLSTIACESPVYDPIPFAARGSSRKVAFFKRPLETNCTPDIEEIESLLASGAKLVFIANHHNPSGLFLDIEVLRAIDDLLVRYDAWGIVDEVYLEFRATWRSETVLNFAKRMVVTSSLTKVYGVGEMRAGWIVGPPEGVSRCRSFWNLMAVNSSSPGLHATIALLPHLDRWFAEDMPVLEANRSLFDEWRTGQGLEIVKNEMSPIVLLRLPKGVDDAQLAEHAFDKHGLFLVPSSYFGLKGYLRIGVFKPRESLIKGLDALANSLRTV